MTFQRLEDITQDEIKRALPVVLSLLRSKEFQDLLLIRIYASAQKKGQLLSERGMRGAIEEILGAHKPPEAEITTAPHPEGGSPKIHDQDITPLNDAKTEEAPEKGSENTTSPGGPAYERLINSKDPHTYVLVTPQGRGIGKYDPLTGRITLHRGSEIPFRNSTRKKDIQDALAYIVSHQNKARREGARLILEEPLVVSSPHTARVLLTGHNNPTREWVNYENKRAPRKNARGGRNRLPNRQLVSFTSHTDPMRPDS